MLVSMIHPFIVHITLTLILLFGMLEIFPKLKETRIAPFGLAIRKMTLLFLILALFSGVMTLTWIERRNVQAPKTVSIHYFMALFGSILFFIFGINYRHSSQLWRPLAVGGILSILAAAALGGKLVYLDHLGTALFPIPH